jgi:hypothetical protein
MEVGAPDDAIAAEAVGSPEDIATEESDTKLLCGLLGSRGES